MRNYSKLLNLLRKEAGTDAAPTVKTSIPLTADSLAAAGLHGATLESDAAKLAAAHDYVLKLAKDRKAVYGLTTSFGGNARHIIPPEEAELLQENLILSHSTNVGELFPYEISRAAFVLRMHTLSQGYSGTSPATMALAAKMLELGIIPTIPMHGSLGASGDIAPLASIALSLIGKGSVWLPGGTERVPTQEAFERFGLSPVKLSYKEGLAQLNGTSMITAVASFNIHYLDRLLDNSLVVSAMSLEALRASSKPFDPRLHALKPHRFQISTAAVMSKILEGSRFVRTHDELRKPIEAELESRTEAFYSKTDLQGGSYSLRAIPQVYHPILSAFDHFKETVGTEINSIDDNPLVLPDEEDELHGANFHGYAVSVASDSMNLSLVGISNLALARIDRLLKSHHSGLPWFLATGKEGLYLGMHGVRFTAAGIGAELRDLSSPVSIHQLPTNNDNQDFVSFGLQSTVKGLEMTILAAYVVAIEWMCATQGIWLRLNDPAEGLAIEDLSPITRAAYEKALTVYQPVKDQDQTLSDKVEELASALLLGNMLPKELRAELGTMAS